MKMLAGNKKSNTPLFENFSHKIPADKHPIEIRIKYIARVAEIIGKEDQSAVSKNQIPAMINNNNFIPACSVIPANEVRRESDTNFNFDSGFISLRSIFPE
jgi:hypothetical protein